MSPERSDADLSHPALAAPPVIEARGLTKRHGDFTAVDGIDFGGVSQRTGGTLAIMGLDPERHGPEVRAHLGVVPQQDNLDEELTVRDNLIVYGRYLGLPYSYLRPKAAELLEFAQLTAKALTPPDHESGNCRFHPACLDVYYGRDRWCGVSLPGPGCRPGAGGGSRTPRPAG